MNATEPRGFQGRKSIPVGGELLICAEFGGVRFDTIPAFATFSSFSFKWLSPYFDLRGQVGFAPSLPNPCWSDINC